MWLNSHEGFEWLSVGNGGGGGRGRKPVKLSLRHGQV